MVSDITTQYQKFKKAVRRKDILLQKLALDEIAGCGDTKTINTDQYSVDIICYSKEAMEELSKHNIEAMLTFLLEKLPVKNTHVESRYTLVYLPFHDDTAVAYNTQAQYGSTHENYIVLFQNWKHESVNPTMDLFWTLVNEITFDNYGQGSGTIHSREFQVITANICWMFKRELSRHDEVIDIFTQGTSADISDTLKRINTTLHEYVHTPHEYSAKLVFLGRNWYQKQKKIYSSDNPKDTTELLKTTCENINTSLQYIGLSYIRFSVKNTKIVADIG